ncbi:hypothetical protein PHYC_03693 [Phycisphaerales bacterium]|nr:hypothetical protein PHYC_03693 [Phycisphaerales bacterium]
MLAKAVAKRGVPSIIGEALAVLLVLGAGALLLAGIHDAGDFERGVLSALPAFLSLLTLSLGAWLTGLGAPHRVGATLHCSHCGYILLEPSDRLVPLCPECSNPWRYFGRARPGERETRPLLFAAGIGAVLLAALGGLYHAELQRSVYESLPTSTLIRYVAESTPGRAFDAWDVLAARTLSASERDRLALALLDKRARWRGLDGAAEEWLDDQALKNALSPAATDRYLGGLVRLNLLGPERTPAGERLEYAVNAELFRSGPSTPLGEVYVILAGYEMIQIEPPPNPVSEPLEGTPFQIPAPPGRIDLPMDPEFLSRATRPRVALFPLQPGRVRVRATAYVAVCSFMPTITWQPDGTPTPFPSAGWLPVVLEREVEVTRPANAAP